MQGKRKVQGITHRGAVTTERVPMGALSPGNRSNCQMSGKKGRKERNVFL